MPKIKALESIADLSEEVQEAILSIPLSDKYFIAFSGGLDSIALVYFCLPYLKAHTKKIQVIHVNHGLSPNALAWASFCKEFCHELGIECHVIEVDVNSDGEGLEAAARKARYAVFDQFLIDGGLLLQGHHLNDNAETVLMRVIKGLGPEAIQGIPKTRVLSKGVLFRPWLGLPREVLESEVKNFGLSWVEDESNQDIRFERNYLRKNVLPLLKKRRPTILYDLERAAKKAQDTSEFIQEWCMSQQSYFLSTDYADDKAIDISQLQTYSSRQQAFILRYWFDLLGVHHPTEKNFQRLFDDLLSAGANTKAEVVWKNHVLKRFDAALFCLPLSINTDLGYKEELHLPSTQEQLIVKDLPYGRLEASLIATDDLAQHQINMGYNKEKDGFKIYCYIQNDLEPLMVRSRLGGDKIYLQSNHSTAIKKLYQSHKILPWHRNKLPLICYEATLIGTLAGFVAKEFAPHNKRAEPNNSSRKFYCFRFKFT